MSNKINIDSFDDFDSDIPNLPALIIEVKPLSKGFTYYVYVLPSNEIRHLITSKKGFLIDGKYNRVVDEK